jgi:hypothetical protein
MQPLAQWSPRAKARLAGAFEALEGLASAFGQVVLPGRLIVWSDASATAANILGHEALLRLAFALSIAGVVFHLAWAWLFYELFKPVNRLIARLAVFVILVGCAVQAVTALMLYAPLIILGGGSAFASFSTPQLQALALLFLKWNAVAFDTYLVFFGLWCVLTGYLIFRSTFLPRVFGALLAIDGLGWMTYVSPPLGVALFPVIAVVSAVAEIPLQLWLLIAGVNSQRWREQATAAEALSAGRAPRAPSAPMPRD